MRFLVVHGDEGGGRALGQTLENLGHHVLVVSYVGEVPESIGVDSIDAVLVGIETPSISGIELAQEVALRAPGLPIGFLASDVTDPMLIDHAAHVGPVLPDRWTEAHVRAVVDLFTRWRERRAASAEDSQPAIVLPQPDLPPTQPMNGAPAAPPRRRVNVSCSWDKLAQLCAGGARITVRSRNGLRPGEMVAISIGVPSEMAISIDGQVDGMVGESASIRLIGMSEERAAELLALCRSRQTV